MPCKKRKVIQVLKYTYSLVGVVIPPHKYYKVGKYAFIWMSF